MSSAGYDLPHATSSFTRYEPRRSSGSETYARSSNSLPAHHDSPSPRRYTPYDSYSSHAGPSYRDDYVNVYRPNTHRPLFGRTPSPNPDLWERPTWKMPPKSPVWGERRSFANNTIPPVLWGRADDQMLATRMFEPSDAWKQNHIDRPLRIDTSDRYLDNRTRSVQAGSPERSSRPIRSPVLIPGSDRYRPVPTKWDHYPSMKGNNYRPTYDSYREPLSPSDNYRRDSFSDTHQRAGSHYEPSYNGRHPSRSGSSHGSATSSRKRRLGSVSRERAVYNGLSPDTREHVSQPIFRDVDELPLKKRLSRASSRSSIASTHLSDNAPPPPAQQPEKPRSDIIVSDEQKSSSSPNGVKSDEVVGGRGAPDDEKTTFPNSARVPANNLPFNKVSAPISVESTLDQKPRSISPANHLPNQVNGITEHVALSGSNTKSSLATSPRVPVYSEIIEQNDEKPSTSLQQNTSLPAPNGDAISKASTDTPVLPTAIPHSSSVACPASDIEGSQAEESVLLPNNIPLLSDATCTTDALRIVVMTKLLCDPQARGDRVDPVILANLAIAPPPESVSTSTPEELVDELYSVQRLESRMNVFNKVRPSLVEYFEARQARVAMKVERLKEEYITLHERWVAHCAALNDQSKILAEAEAVPQTGRTTRRSTAIGDAVRSDLEMEQIIASLGNDDATDANYLSARNLATEPDMISVVKDTVDYTFDDCNQRIDNPDEYYAPQTGMHDWTEPEVKIFIDKFAAYPKQFGVIADFLPNKTAAQCVDYYYLHKKKHIDFRKVVTELAPNKRRRRGTGKKRGNGLLADIAQHDAEVHRDSASPSMTGRPARGRKPMPPPDPKKAVGIRLSLIQSDLTPTPTPTPEPEIKARRRRPAPVTRDSPAAAVVVSVSDAAKIPASDTADFPDETLEIEQRPTKRAKRTRQIKSAAFVSDEMGTPAPDPNGDQSDSTGKRKPHPSLVWSEDDKKLFLSLVSQYGANFKRIASGMPNKTTIQVQHFYNYYEEELDLAAVAAKAPKRSPTPTSPKLNIVEFVPPVSPVSPMSNSTTSRITHTTQINAHPTSTVKTDTSRPTAIAKQPASWSPSESKSTWPPPNRSPILSQAKKSDTAVSSNTHLTPQNLNHHRHYPSATYSSQYRRSLSGALPQHPVHQAGPISNPIPTQDARSNPYLPPYSPEIHTHYPAYDPRTINSYSTSSYPLPMNHLSRQVARAGGSPPPMRREYPNPVLPWYYPRS